METKVNLTIVCITCMDRGFLSIKTDFQWLLVYTVCIYFLMYRGKSFYCTPLSFSCHILLPILNDGDLYYCTEGYKSISSPTLIMVINYGLSTRHGLCHYSRIHINRGEWFSLMTFYKHYFLVMWWLPWKFQNWLSNLWNSFTLVNVLIIDLMWIWLWLRSHRWWSFFH